MWMMDRNEEVISVGDAVTYLRLSCLRGQSSIVKSAISTQALGRLIQEKAGAGR